MKNLLLMIVVLFLSACSNTVRKAKVISTGEILILRGWDFTPSKLGDTLLVQNVCDGPYRVPENANVWKDTLIEIDGMQRRLVVVTDMK